MSTLRLLARFGSSTLREPRRSLWLCSDWAPQHRLLLCPVTSAAHCVKTTPFASSQCWFSTKNSPDRAGKTDTKASQALAEEEIFGTQSKLSIFARFKLMYKKYWYVLIPVHVVTSIGWFSAFYYFSKSGVDIPTVLNYLHFSQTIIDKVQHSNSGHLALAYVCYKIATPVRYALTLGCTTVSIKYLVQYGHIKPLPTKQEFFKMYEQKRASNRAEKLDKLEKLEKSEKDGQDREK